MIKVSFLSNYSITVEYLYLRGPEHKVKRQPSRPVHSPLSLHPASSDIAENYNR